MPKRFTMNELTQLLADDEWPEEGTTGRDLGWFDLAELDLQSGTLWVGDPAFSWAELAGGDGIRITLEPGRYAVSAFVMAFGDGNFIARLRVCWAGTTKPTLGGELAEAGTDSAGLESNCHSSRQARRDSDGHHKAVNRSRRKCV